MPREITTADIQRGQRWVAARKDKELSQGQLAQEISRLTKQVYRRTVSQQAIGLIELGETRNPWFIREAAQVLEVTPAWLQFGADAIDELSESTIQAAIELEHLPEDIQQTIKTLIKQHSGTTQKNSQ